MRVSFTIALMALVLVLAAVYTDSRIQYVPPAKLGIKLKEGAAWWKRWIVNKNYGLRYGALFMIWASFSLDLIVYRFHDGFFHFLLIGLGIASILVYAFVLAWSVLIRESEKHRG